MENLEWSTTAKPKSALWFSFHEEWSQIRGNRSRFGCHKVAQVSQENAVHLMGACSRKMLAGQRLSCVPAASSCGCRCRGIGGLLYWSSGNAAARCVICVEGNASSYRASFPQFAHQCRSMLGVLCACCPSIVMLRSKVSSIVDLDFSCIIDSAYY